MSSLFPAKLVEAAGRWAAGESRDVPAAVRALTEQRTVPASVMRHCPAPGPEACQSIVRMISENATLRVCAKTLRCIPLGANTEEKERASRDRAPWRRRSLVEEMLDLDFQGGSATGDLDTN